MLKTATCQCCNRSFFTSEMIKTSLAKRGGANAYMCARCATQNQGYHAQSTKNRGTRKVNDVQNGIELETSFTDEYARNTLFAYGLIPTHDCSLSSEGEGSRYGWDDRNACEYVTGIMQGLNIPSKMCASIEKLMQEGHLKINESCGTHFHISVNSMRDKNGAQVYMGYIQRFYHPLFVPLCEAMQAEPATTKRIFGRYFDHHYCEAVNINTYANSRYNFINITNASNIEFRLNKFVSAKQYQNLMKMEVEMVQAIITNFCEHFNDTKIDHRRYENMTAYRKHKAQVTGAKLVKIYKKYAGI